MRTIHHVFTGYTFFQINRGNNRNLVTQNIFVMIRILILFIAWITCMNTFSQEYPFQNIKLSDEERITNIISLMTLDEKINCLSYSPAVPRLGIQINRLVEGLHGLAYSGPANWAVKGDKASPTTTFPQAIGLAEMWDPGLLQQLADQEATEARFLAQNKEHGVKGLIVLAPNADMGRDIRWGRTEECYGEDPFLNATLVTAYVKGLQGNDPKYWKTASLMKHFLANSNENDRMTSSSDFDERLFREYYSYAFYKGVSEGGAQCFMAAYNKYNGIPCMVNPVLKKVTMDDWGLHGVICTDGGALATLINDHKWAPDLAHGAAEGIKAGISMFLDNYKQAVKDALAEGLITEKDIETVIYRNLWVLMKLGKLDHSPDNPYSAIGVTDTIKPWTTAKAKELARRATQESVVLLKNENKLLPLNKDNLKSVAVIGPVADVVVSDWYSGTPPYRVSVLEGVRNALGTEVTLNYAASNMADSAVVAARTSDVAIVCIGNHPLSHGLGWGVNYVPSDGREAIDRQAVTSEQEDLVRLVLAANPNTILVLVSSFPYAINWSKSHVPAILHITQSSQELGNGLADVIFGKVSPAGRLVQTWITSIDQLPPILDYNIRNGRTYMYDKNEPLFPFGYGLSYSDFVYSGLKTSEKILRDGDEINITFTVTNTGDFDSDEVSQLYVSYEDPEVEHPPIAMKGFRRTLIPEGESVMVTIPLKTSDLKYWDVESQSWKLSTGKLKFYVGGSSVDKRLTGEVLIKGR